MRIVALAGRSCRRLAWAAVQRRARGGEAVEQPTLLPLFLVVALAIVLDVLPTYAPTPRALPRSPWSCRARAEQPPARWRRRFLRRSRLAPRRGRHMRLFRTCSGCPSPRRPRCPPRSLAAALRAPHPAPSHLPTPLPPPWPSRAGVVPIPTSAASPSRAHAPSPRPTPSEPPAQRQAQPTCPGRSPAPTRLALILEPIPHRSPAPAPLPTLAHTGQPNRSVQPSRAPVKLGAGVLWRASCRRAS